MHLNVGLSVEQPCYEVAQRRRRKMQRLGVLVGGCWWEVGGRIRVRGKKYAEKNFRKNEDKKKVLKTACTVQKQVFW